MQNLMYDLTKLFQKDDRIFADGKLLKNKLTELALKLDQSLIELLLSNNRSRENFFIEQTVKKEKVLVFDKDKFISFVNNKEFLPDSFTSFKNKIGLMSNGDYLKEKSDVVLAWAYKDCVLEGGQDKEDQKRDEIFYNETLAPDEIDRLYEPKVLKNFKKFDAKGEHQVSEFNADDNLIIKGNNLLALHCLKKKYRGKVKLIYIDPPYNKGNDSFKYNDKFNHSSWLSFMKNRLEIAKELLKDEGVIFISIDDNEIHFLRVLCDEIFQRGNYISTVIVQNNPKGRVMDKNFATSHEYLLIYSKGVLNSELTLKKSETDIKKNYPEKDHDGWFRSLELRNTHRQFGKHNRPNLFFPLFVDTNGLTVSLEKDDNHSFEILPIWEDGFEGCWSWSKTKCEVENHLLIARKVNKKWKVFRKAYSTDKHGNTVSKKLKTIWLRKDFHTEKGQKTVNSLLGNNAFYAPKPVEYIKTIIELSMESDLDGYILDFFAGSGTTAHAILELNKDTNSNYKFILCEQMDYVNNVTVKRVHKVIKNNGEGSFIYAELTEWNEKYMQDIKDADTSPKLLNIYKKMKKETFFRYDIDFSKFNEKEFMELSLKNQRQVLCECLDKNHLYVNLSEIDDATYKVSPEDKKLNKEFYRENA